MKVSHKSYKLLFLCNLLLYNKHLLHLIETKEQCVARFESWDCQSSTVGCHLLCENKGYEGFEFFEFMIYIYF